MPELPEVQTTVDGINIRAKGLKILDIWSDYNSPFHKGKDNISDLAFFSTFKKSVIGTKIKNATRRGKNVLIHLSNNKTILVHMKMTGHFLYGTYEMKSGKWNALESALTNDPFNRHVRLVFSLSNGKSLVLCDMRKFAKVTLIDTNLLEQSKHLSAHGPEPLDSKFTTKNFKDRLLTKPNGKIKQVLMNPEVISGIGNIYSDEILWRSGVHPLSSVKNIPDTALISMFKATQNLLREGISFGGDSMSDYRNIDGVPGKFQAKHEAYQRTGEKCRKRGCTGVIKKIKLGGRSAHFCSVHQKIKG
jgi:formamidopyrimidine-DNA glycosylase